MSQTSRFLSSVAPALALVSMIACGTSDTADRQPLGAAAPGMQAGASGPQLPLAALNALDEGNAAYRAKEFATALAKYREAAAAAPAHAAPWFGMYMVASEMQNTALADSAMARVKSLSADPAALDAHAEVSAASAGGAGGAAQPGGPLPAGHPSTTPELPAGHPSTTPLPQGHPTPSAPMSPRKPADSARRGRA